VIAHCDCLFTGRPGQDSNTSGFQREGPRRPSELHPKRPTQSYAVGHVSTSPVKISLAMPVGAVEVVANISELLLSSVVVRTPPVGPLAC